MRSISKAAATRALWEYLEQQGICVITDTGSERIVSPKGPGQEVFDSVNDLLPRIGDDGATILSVVRLLRLCVWTRELVHDFLRDECQ